MKQDLSPARSRPELQGFSNGVNVPWDDTIASN